MSKLRSHAYDLRQFEDHLSDLTYGTTDIWLVFAHLPSFGRLGGDEPLIEVTNALFRVAGPERTIGFPTYALYSGTIQPILTSSGALSQMILHRPGGVRSQSLLHSHLYFGPKSNGLASASVGSFSNDSDFQRQISADATLIVLGGGLSKGGTFLHQLEADVGVPYREWVDISKKLQTTSGREKTLHIPYFARCTPSLEENFERIEIELLEMGIARSLSLPRGRSVALNMREASEHVRARLSEDPYVLVHRET